MPPGSITNLRKRSSRPAIFACSLPRSIEPSVVSVTPTALKSTGWRAFGIRLSAGHSPAWAVNAKPVVAMKAAAATVRSKTLLVEVYILISSLFRRGPRRRRRSDYNDEARQIGKEMPGCSNRDSKTLFRTWDLTKNGSGERRGYFWFSVALAAYARRDGGDHH